MSAPDCKTKGLTNSTNEKYAMTQNDKREIKAAAKAAAARLAKAIEDTESFRKARHAQGLQCWVDQFLVEKKDAAQ